MQYLVVAYPRLDAADARWVQMIRQQYDPHTALIAPHFTLVFPTQIADERRCLLDLRQQASPFAPFTFVNRQTVRDKLRQAPLAQAQSGGSR